MLAKGVILALVGPLVLGALLILGALRDSDPPPTPPIELRERDAPGERSGQRWRDPRSRDRSAPAEHGSPVSPLPPAPAPVPAPVPPPPLSAPDDDGDHDDDDADD